MFDNELLAERFEAERAHLGAVAYRMLGSLSEAEDAVQEAWIRLSRSDTSAVENLSGWLTTVVARVCLNVLRLRATRGETTLDEHPTQLATAPDERSDPEHEAVLADSVGLALLVVLDALSPAERLALVLHDMFAVPFDEIAAILDRSPAAARQLASRARSRVQGASPGSSADLARRGEIVGAFLAASRGGDFEALLTLLDPDAVLRADEVAVHAGATGVVRGAAAVAATLSGRARAAQPALVDGTPGLVWAPGGRPKAVFDFTIAGSRVMAIDLMMDPARIAQLSVEIADG